MSKKPKKKNQEETEDILWLTDADDQQIPFNVLDLIPYQGAEYAILAPAQVEEGEEVEVLILQVEALSKDESNYIMVEDEALLDTLFELFQEKNAKFLNFA